MGRGHRRRRVDGLRRCDRKACGGVALSAGRDLRRGADALRPGRQDVRPLQAAARPGGAAEPLLGWQVRRGGPPAGVGHEPGRSRLRLVAVRPHRRLRGADRRARAVLRLRHAGLGERGQGDERRAEPGGRSAELRARRRQALQRDLQGAGRNDPAGGEGVACLERAEQPDLPHAAVSQDRDTAG